MPKRVEFACGAAALPRTLTWRKSGWHVGKPHHVGGCRCSVTFCRPAIRRLCALAGSRFAKPTRAAEERAGRAAMSKDGGVQDHPPARACALSSVSVPRQPAACPGLRGRSSGAGSPLRESRNGRERTEPWCSAHAVASPAAWRSWLRAVDADTARVRTSPSLGVVQDPCPSAALLLAGVLVPRGPAGFAARFVCSPCVGSHLDRQCTGALTCRCCPAQMMIWRTSSSMSSTKTGR